ncbi:MAG TPA: c-type cytochrome [Cyclobacteriaceae bacterium]|jgi:mono/diheme cytochrome c family protein
MSLKTSPSTVVKHVLIFLFFCIGIASIAQEADSVAAASDDTEMIAKGQTLFQQNCAQCHRVQAKLIGPALAGINDRRELSWIINFVKNSQKVITSGDEYANNLFNEYNKVEMPAFDFFTDEDITSIISYVQTEAGKPAEVVQTSDAGQGATTAQAPTGYLIAILIGLLFVIFLILIVLILIVGILKRYLDQKGDLGKADQEVVSGTIDWGKVLRSKAAMGAIAFVFTAIVLKSVIDGLYHIGVQQDYAPTQPILFSHARHAGQFAIDCNYCHTGVRKSKSANIPSANICMNCHTEILRDSPEIQKIYTALANDTPIEWVRVHNLPDLAYFNHAQHVQVANIECQTCHGPVEEMEVVRQFAPLTMGWCIDCHRKTDVNTRGNGYYNKLVELHEKNSKEPMKVEDIGGLECARCHY